MLSNHTDDALARTAAERQVTDALIDNEAIGAVVGTSDTGVARRVLEQVAKTVNFETAISKVKGQEIGLRRLVMVGEWEVDPGAKVREDV
jgi:F0F1-type ATP synthase gamma subunit